MSGRDGNKYVGSSSPHLCFAPEQQPSHLPLLLLEICGVYWLDPSVAPLSDQSWLFPSDSNNNSDIFLFI